MEIIINGTIAELGDSIPAITKKGIDINNPSTRSIDISNRFQLPDTIINRKIFDSPQGIGTNNRSFDKLYDVVINDVFQIFKGKGFLDSASKDTFGFQVIDNSKDLFNAINISLKSILWDDKDTTLTEAGINALDSLDPDNCWFWGKACLHYQAMLINTDQTTGDDRCKYSRPSFYVQALLKRAIETAGYSVIFSGKDLAFSSYHKDFYFTSYQKTLNFTQVVTSTYTLTGLDTYDFKLSRIGVANATITETLTFMIRLRGHITSTPGMYIKTYSVDSTGTKIIENLFALPEDGQIDFTTSEIHDGATGMINSFILVGTGTVVFDDVLLYFILNENTELLSTNPWINSKIKAYDMLPDITYLDLFKLICIINNQYPIVDNYNKVLTFGNFSNLNKLNCNDWSKKFVIGSQQVSSNYTGIAQLNNLKYDNDKTVSVDYGCGSFVTDNESLPAEADYIKLAYGASKEVVINNNLIVNVPVYEDDKRIPEQDLNIRLFSISTDKLQFSDISWRNLVLNNYADIADALYRIRAITCEVVLSKLDFITWTPVKLAYIDYFKTIFIVLEIGNFIPGRATKVKLLAYGR